MNRIALLVSAFSLLSGRAHSPAEPRFSVEEKSTLAKTFERSMKLESTAVRLFLEGQEEPIEGHGDVHLSIEDSGRIEVTDEYLAMGKGRPSKLKRTFDKLQESEHQKVRAASPDDEDGEQDHKRTEESELEGKSVLFTWNGETNAYVASFPEGKGEDSLLEDLTEDMDMRFLLPKGQVSEGDTWDVDAKSCGSLLAPGGDLKLKDKDEEEESGSGMGKEIRKHLEGKAKATWKGTREEAGRKLGIIAIDVDLTSEGEMPKKGADGSSTRFKVDLEIEGDLAWDLEAGHFHSLHAGGKVHFGTSTTRTIELGGESKALRQEVELEGETTYAASIR